MRQDVVRAGEGPDYDWSQDHVSVKMPLELTAGRVTVVEDTLKPGFHLARHYHRSMVEIFYILNGVVTFAFDDAVAVATPGMTLNVPPEVRHEVTCEAGVLPSDAAKPRLAERIRGMALDAIRSTVAIPVVVADRA